MVVVVVVVVVVWRRHPWPFLLRISMRWWVVVEVVETS